MVSIRLRLFRCENRRLCIQDWMRHGLDECCLCRSRRRSAAGFYCRPKNKKARRMHAAAAPRLTASGAVTWRYAGYDKMLRPDGHASSHNLHAEQFERGVVIHSGIIDANLPNACLSGGNSALFPYRACGLLPWPECFLFCRPEGVPADHMPDVPLPRGFCSVLPRAL